jgi:hypothetical protein
MASSIFVSYSHADMTDIDWIGRLLVYMAPLQRSKGVDIWHDGRIAIGDDWEAAIDAALKEAAAAVLVVGPGFLRSDFILDRELPVLLKAVTEKKIPIFPLVVGYCAYASSPLNILQAANNPDQPLESLPRAEQNRILNELSLRIANRIAENPKVAVRDSTYGIEYVTDEAFEKPESDGPAWEAIKQLAKEYDDTRDQMASGSARTHRMVKIFREMIGVAAPARSKINELRRSTSAGRRLAAIAILQVLPDPDCLDWLADRLDPTAERPFVAGQASVALLQAVRSLPQPFCELLRTSIDKAVNLAEQDKRDPSRLTILNSAIKELSARCGSLPQRGNKPRSFPGRRL